MLLEALAERRIGRRDQAQAWVWRLAELHPRPARGVRGAALARDQAPARACCVNSSGRAHGRNARRLVHAARNQDRRLAAALLAAAVAHTPEGEEVLRGARMRAARKPSGVARELLRNFPKSGAPPPPAQAQGRRAGRQRRGKGGGEGGGAKASGAKRGGAKAKASSNGGEADEHPPDEREDSANGEVEVDDDVAAEELDAEEA